MLRCMNHEWHKVKSYRRFLEIVNLKTEDDGLDNRPES